MEIRNSSIQINIMRSGSPLSQIAEQTVTGLTPGSYEVIVFDWERDGSVASTPSYVGNATVTPSYVNVTEPEPELLSSVPPTTRKLCLKKQSSPPQQKQQVGGYSNQV